MLKINLMTERMFSHNNQANHVKNVRTPKSYQNKTTRCLMDSNSIDRWRLREEKEEKMRVKGGQSLNKLNNFNRAMVFGFLVRSLNRK